MKKLITTAILIALTGMILTAGCVTKPRKCQMNHEESDSVKHKNAIGMGSSEIMEIIREIREIMGE